MTRKLSTVLFMAIIMTMVASLFGTTTVTIGTGTSTGRYPLNDYYVYSRSQCLYLQSEIGLTNGLITKLRWYRNDSGADPNAIGTTEIWLTELPGTTLSGSTWINPGTLVASISNIDLGSGAAWYEIDITDYEYGGGNLLVSVRTQNAPYTTPHSYWRYTSTSSNYRMLAGNSDSSNPPSLSTSYNRPNIQMDIEDLVINEPPNPATSPNPADTATGIGRTPTLSWASGGGSPISYNVYFGTDNPPATLVSELQAGTTYVPGTLSYGQTYYWKIDPYNANGYASDASPIPVWSFTVMDDPTITSFPHTQSFDATTYPPAGWVSEIGSGASGWQRVASSSNPTLSPYAGAGMLFYNSFNLNTPANATLISPPINASLSTNMYTGSFWMYRDGSNYLTTLDKVEVYTNSSPSLTGATLLGTVHRSYTQTPVETAAGWYQYTFEMGMGSRDTKYFLLKAVSAYGNNMNVDEITFASVEGGNPPNPATSPSPASTATNVAITTNLSWSSGGGAPTSYFIYFGRDAESLELLTEQSETTYDFPANLEFDKAYFWKVDPHNEAGLASDIAELPVWEFTTANGIAITPSPANSAVNQDATNRVLNWADVTGASGYRVKAGTSTGASDLVDMAEVTESQYTHTANWPFSQQIYWTVYTLNGSQVVDGTEWTFTTADDPTLTPNFIQDFSLTTFPPANWTRWSGQLLESSTLTSTTSGFSRKLFGNTGADYGTAMNIYSTNKYWLVTPPVNLDAKAGGLVLECDAKLTDWNATTTGTMDVDDYAAIVISTDGTWSSNNVLKFWNQANPLTTEHVQLDLSAYSGTVKFGFYGASGASGSDIDLFFDNIEVKVLSENPVFEVTPASKDFGVVQINTVTPAQNFTIKNSGMGELNISSVSLEGDNANEFMLTDANEYEVVLGPNETMVVSVEFAPTSLGAKTANLLITDNLSKAQHSVALSGTGFDSTITEYPYSEGFDTATFPPVGWTNYSVNKTTHAYNATGYWSRKTTGTYNTTAGCAFISYNYSSTHDACLQLPNLNIPASHRLSFYWRDNDSKVADHDTTFCEISIDGGATWTVLASLSPAATQSAYQKVDVGLNPYAGNGRMIRFRDTTDASYSAWGTHLDAITIAEGWDYPAGEPVVIGDETITITGGNANNGSGSIPSIPNAAFVAAGSYVLQLLGAGPWTVSIETTAPWGAYFSNGHWISVQNIGGFITFEVEASKDADVPVVLGDTDPTLPVELSSFTATITSNLAVKIAWIAQSETNHSGYNILRAEANNLGSALKINPSLIDNGTPLGTQISYSYTDVEAYSNMVYYYWLESVSLDGISEFFGPLSITIGDPSQEPVPPITPVVTKLMNAFPNPFNPTTNIRYSLKEAGMVNISIFNVKGQLIKTITNDHDAPGYYQITWDGRDMNGKPVSSGIYMYRMTSGKYSEAKKMILAK